VRYAYHGKIRATGEAVDGFIEADNSSDAIDQLADEGIIGVQTVRPAPLPHQKMLVGPDGHAPSAEVVLTNLVDKLTGLVGQVERLLSRPVHVTGGAPVRGNASAQRHAGNPQQNAALKAIFETNVELRRSLEKLAHVTASMKPANAASNGAKTEALPVESTVIATAPVAAPAPAREAAVHPAAVIAPVVPVTREAAPHPTPSVRERPVHAQPAA
jgi:hypothetical protein